MDPSLFIHMCMYVYCAYVYVYIYVCVCIHIYIIKLRKAFRALEGPPMLNLWENMGNGWSATERLHSVLLVVKTNQILSYQILVKTPKFMKLQAHLNICGHYYFKQ